MSPDHGTAGPWPNTFTTASLYCSKHCNSQHPPNTDGQASTTGFFIEYHILETLLSSNIAFAPSASNSHLKFDYFIRHTCLETMSLPTDGNSGLGVIDLDADKIANSFTDDDNDQAVTSQNEATDGSALSDRNNNSTNMYEVRADAEDANGNISSTDQLVDLPNDKNSDRALMELDGEETASLFTNPDSDHAITDQDEATNPFAISDEKDDPAEMDNRSGTGKPVNVLCRAMVGCVTNSRDYRKVVSHIFGRNKKSTLSIPEDVWLIWCRMHYQRYRYRADWHIRQLDCVRRQLDSLEDWGEIHGWEIDLRKAERGALDLENTLALGNPNQVLSCWERFLLPYLGKDKTFAHVRAVLTVIEAEFNTSAYNNRNDKDKVFPGVEFLPDIPTSKGKKPTQKNKRVRRYQTLTLAKVKINTPEKKHPKKVSERNDESGTLPKSNRSGLDCQTMQSKSVQKAGRRKFSDTIGNHSSNYGNTITTAATANKAITQESTTPRKRRRLVRGLERVQTGDMGSPEKQLPKIAESEGTKIADLGMSEII